ncbi:MAG: metallophosphoesterase family protein [Bacteroidota bacterium]|jgi:diadenosine tetraphosphatase ApaH/serine/threonine PP2A family protein phosphatase|nr:metallophosphoesterase family protein [Bacteroidota bacterium]
MHSLFDITPHCVPVRLAIISDIHANLDALHAVLADIDAVEADRIVCLGDIVGYGADPSACLALVRERVDLCVLGNHDAATFSVPERAFFNPNARLALEWTIAQLSADDLAFLRGLPYRVSKDDLLFVHSAPRAPEQWDYVFTGMEARGYGRHFHERICFIGHSHVPGIFPIDAGAPDYAHDRRFLINVGSVGQPRDGNWRASYGVLDTVAGSYENRRVAYDVEAAGRKIISRGLPRRIAERLRSGV